MVAADVVVVVVVVVGFGVVVVFFFFVVTLVVVAGSAVVVVSAVVSVAVSVDVVAFSVGVSVGVSAAAVVVSVKKVVVSAVVTSVSTISGGSLSTVSTLFLEDDGEIPTPIKNKAMHTITFGAVLTGNLLESGDIRNATAKTKIPLRIPIPPLEIGTNATSAVNTAKNHLTIFKILPLLFGLMLFTPFRPSR